MEKRVYEMTKEELEEIQEIGRTPGVFLDGPLKGYSQQHNANTFWKKLSEKYGFDPYTPRPVPDKGPEFFTAKPKE